ncbi:MAG: adenosylcobinamide kinase [Gammaproteobacteria bacterium]|nr:adenosylcobinamide kinase [Gammaproteobacteria bacterium]
MKTLLIGGARSGKSALSARWAGERSGDVCCVVTATASDDEMSARIAAHRRERPQHWRVREEPVRLGAALREEARTGGLLLVDCLTLWTANCLWPPHPASGATGTQHTGDLQPDMSGWEAERAEFFASLHAVANEVIVVSNEVGTGLVPEHAAARLFRDEQGRLNQGVAAACDAVFLVTAGLALRLK